MKKGTTKRGEREQISIYCDTTFKESVEKRAESLDFNLSQYFRRLAKDDLKKKKVALSAILSQNSKSRTGSAP